MAWWEKNMFVPYGLYPEELGEMLSASAQEPKSFAFADLDTLSDSFVIKVKGQASDTGEIWWHQRRLDLAGRLFEAQRMIIPFSAQGRGKGRLLMADLVETAKRLGIRQIDIEAQDIGRYAWARFGFLPDRGSWKFQVSLEARRRLLRARPRIEQRRFAHYSDVLDSDDPASIRVVASWRDRIDSLEYDANGNALEVELGKALLLETSAQWFGSFDLDDPETMAVYREYVRSLEDG